MRVLALLPSLFGLSGSRAQTVPTIGSDAFQYAEISSGRIGSGVQVTDRAHFEPTAAARKAADEEATWAVVGKLWEISVPKVFLRGVRLADAAEILQRESVRLDVDPAPGARGVRISVSPPQSSSPGEPLVTLSEEGMPLMTALTELARQAGMELKIDRHGAFILPLVPNEAGLATTEFRVPPIFVASLRLYDPPQDPSPARGANAGNAPPGRPPRPSAYLEAQGVPWPPGASAAYLAATSKLVVRNTPEGIAVVQSLVEKSWEQTIPPNPTRRP